RAARASASSSCRSRSERLEADPVRAGAELHTRALERIVHRLAAAAQVTAQKCFRDGMKGQTVHGSTKAMTFVGVQRVSNGNGAPLERLHHLITFDLRRSRIIGALDDQQWSAYAINRMQG